MILGVGIDLVEIKRMERWANFQNSSLLKIFSDQELADCTNKASILVLEKLASRFAAKEAFYKALSAALVKLGKTDQTFSLLFTCQNVQIITASFDVPALQINWTGFEGKIKCTLPQIYADVSLSHEESVAAAVVILSAK